MATVPDAEEEQQLHTMDIAEILPSPLSTPPPLRRPVPVGRVPARAHEALFFARVVGFFVGYLALALARWPLRALPRLQAFAAGIYARVRVEWARAYARARR